MVDNATGADAPRSRKWVVGVDGSECSRHAALWAAANIEGRASELQLASAWSMPVAAGMKLLNPMLIASTIAATHDATTATVADLARGLSPGVSVPVTTSVGQSSAASLLLDAAHHSELLVVGSRGRGGFARLMLGSTSTQCATHSSAPVAVIPPSTPATRPHSIVVAFDGSANASGALEWAVEFADPGSFIDCVFVWDTTPIAVGSEQFFLPEANDLALERFEYLAGKVIEEHRRADISVRNVFAEGDPRDALADVSTDIDLLVVGARGHGAIGSAMLGSVSTWLLHHVHRAIVVVPPHGVHQEVDDHDGDEKD